MYTAAKDHRLVSKVCVSKWISLYSYLYKLIYHAFKGHDALRRKKLFCGVPPVTSGGAIYGRRCSFLPHTTEFFVRVGGLVGFESVTAAELYPHERTQNALLKESCISVENRHMLYILWSDNLFLPANQRWEIGWKGITRNLVSRDKKNFG